MSTHRGVVKSAGIIGTLTACSRVLGFVRDLVIATAFGTGIAAEAFVVSFKIPNLLRDLVGEGATNAAFVPVLTECNEKKKEDFWPLVSTLFFIMGIILVFLTLLGVFFAPQIVALIAPGFVHSVDPEKFPLAVRLTRVIFPYIFLIGLSALAMGVLNTLKEFTSSALGPILLNICMIMAGFFFEKIYGPMALVFGVLAGGALQLACQAPALYRAGFRWHRPILGHSSVKRIGKLLVPRALGSALYQINVFVDSILASFEQIVGLGGQSALYYSNRLFQLPLAIFGIAMAQAILPTFSSQLVRGDTKAFKESFSMAVRTIFLVALPAALGLILLSEPIIRIIFERGKFDAYSTSITSAALFYYGFGLISCSFIKILVNSFYAMQDTRTPVKTMAFSVMLNVALSLLLMRHLKIGGLALASSISATVNMAILYYLLRKKIGPMDERGILRSFFKVLLAAILMGVLVFVFKWTVLGRLVGEARLYQLSALFIGIATCVAAYIGAAYLLGVNEIRRLFKR